MKRMAYINALFTFLSFASCQIGEPDYENILYGGVWKWPVSNTTAEDEDVMKAVEAALMYLEDRIHHTLRKYDGSLVPYRVNNLQKVKLVFTSDDWQPYLQSSVDVPSSHDEMSAVLVFGYTYTFQIDLVVKNMSTSHHFVVTMYPQGRLHIYAHRSRDMNNFIQKNQTSVQEEITQVACDFVSHASDGNMELNVFPTRSCTLRRADHVVGDQQSCSNDVVKKMHEQLSGDSDGKHCGLRSDILFNITIMTYNIWNFNARPKKGNAHYVDRIRRLGKVINTYKPDIIAFQEVRFEHSKGGVLGPNQVKHLADMLTEYQFVYQPAQLQPTSLREGRTEEGVAVFSRYPILDHHYLKLFRNHSNSADRHQRVCQHVEIGLPFHKKVYVFNTHLSLSHEAREQSVIEIFNYMRKFDGTAIVTGDFNAEPQEHAMRYIYDEKSLIDAWYHIHGNTKTGYTYSTINEDFTKRIDYIFVEKGKNIHILDAEILDDGSKGYIYDEKSLIDAWYHIHGNTKTGYTYSTINEDFTKRIDYIFVEKGKNIHILDAEILDDGSKGEKAASDHVPVVGTFGFS